MYTAFLVLSPPLNRFESKTTIAIVTNVSLGVHANDTATAKNPYSLAAWTIAKTSGKVAWSTSCLPIAEPFTGGSDPNGMHAPAGAKYILTSNASAVNWLDLESGKVVYIGRSIFDLDNPPLYIGRNAPMFVTQTPSRGNENTTLSGWDLSVSTTSAQWTIDAGTGTTARVIVPMGVPYQRSSLQATTLVPLGVYNDTHQPPRMHAAFTLDAKDGIKKGCATGALRDPNARAVPIGIPPSPSYPGGLVTARECLTTHTCQESDPSYDFVAYSLSSACASGDTFPAPLGPPSVAYRPFDEGDTGYSTEGFVVGTRGVVSTNIYLPDLLSANNDACFGTGKGPIGGTTVEDALHCGTTVANLVAGTSATPSPSPKWLLPNSAWCTTTARTPPGSGCIGGCCEWPDGKNGTKYAPCKSVCDPTNAFVISGRSDSRTTPGSGDVGVILSAPGAGLDAANVTAYDASDGTPLWFFDFSSLLAKEDLLWPWPHEGAFPPESVRTNGASLEVDAVGRNSTARVRAISDDAALAFVLIQLDSKKNPTKDRYVIVLSASDGTLVFKSALRNGDGDAMFAFSRAKARRFLVSTVTDDGSTLSIYDW